MPLALWRGNFVYIGENYLAEEPHLLKCIAENGNLCMCLCKDCVDRGKCLCLDCACHELGKHP
jgi:hypothetical protein